MNEPVFHGYTDGQWQQIKGVVDRLGVDADKVMIGKHRLRDELVDLARWYLVFARWERLRRTPKQRAVILRERLGEIEIVSRQFARRKPGDVAMYLEPDTARTLVAALDKATAELQVVLDAGANAGNRSKQNASKGERHAYLTELVKAWNQIPETQGAKRKLKINFLHACGAPTFQTDEKAIINFLDRPKTSN